MNSKLSKGSLRLLSLASNEEVFSKEEVRETGLIELKRKITLRNKVSS